MIELSTIQSAQQVLAKYLPATPCTLADSLSSGERRVFLKQETVLPTGSFKPRGALYALVTNLAQRPISEVTASSTGNHGAAVAYAGKTLGVPATIFLPSNPNPVKRAKIQQLGAKIVEAGAQDLAGAFQLALDDSHRAGVYFLNDATDPDLPAGPATIGLEVLQQIPDVTAIYVSMGDTALIRGVASAAKRLKPSVQIIGVQAERAPSYYLSWKKGDVIETSTCDTCADGLATRTPDAENVRAIRELVDDVVLVSEEQMLETIRHLYRKQGVLAEPAGAAATAAYLKSPQAGTVVLLVTGCNITDPVRHQAGILVP